VYSLASTHFGSYDFDSYRFEDQFSGTASHLAPSAASGGTKGQTLFDVKQSRKQRDSSNDSGWSSSAYRGGKGDGMFGGRSTPILSGFFFRRNMSDTGLDEDTALGPARTQVKGATDVLKCNRKTYIV